jgi:hypothetical protein
LGFQKIVRDQQRLDRFLGVAAAGCDGLIRGGVQAGAEVVAGISDAAGMGLLFPLCSQLVKSAHRQQVRFPHAPGWKCRNPDRGLSEPVAPIRLESVPP